MSKHRGILNAAAALACACALALAIGGTLQPPAAEAPAIAAAPQAASTASPEPASPIPDATASYSAESARDAAGTTSGASSGGSPADHDPSSLIASLAENVTPAQMQEALDATPGLDGVAVQKSLGDGLVKLTLPAGLGADQALALIGPLDQVASAQFDYRYHTQDDGTADATAATEALAWQASASAARLAAGTPLAAVLGAQATANDPAYKSGGQWALSSVNAPAAWDRLSANATGDSAVTVAVIDNGFIVDHEDLMFHVVDTYDAVADEATISSTECDHGTHVAGIVSAVCSNGKGVASIADNALGLMLVSVYDSKRDEITTSTVISAYDYIVKNASTHNVRVVNMSLGAGTKSPVSRKSDPALYDAIAKARNAGIVTVSAACNSDDGFSPPFYAFPSDFDNVVSVMNLKPAPNSTDGVERDEDSNYNASDQGESAKAKNICAPGTRIYSTLDASTSSYGWMSGTSMAAPLVAGVFGLMFAVNPKLTAPQAETLLYNSAKDLVSSPAKVGWDHETGYGEVDAEAAVKAAGATAVSTKTSIATCTITANDAAYTASDLKPAVKVANGSTTLKSGTDYTLTYRDNKETGKAAFTVRGIGNYCGVAVGTFSISQATIGSVALASSKVAYNGRAHKPVVETVSTKSGKAAAGDYTVTYWRGAKKTTDFKSVGEITVRVVGKGNCTGKATAKFTIVPKGTSLAKLQGAKKRVTVKWKKQVKQTSGYQIRLSTNKSFTKNVKTVAAKASVAKKAVKGLKAKKRYYAKIRTYKKVDGKTFYSAWSKVKSAKTKR